MVAKPGSYQTSFNSGELMPELHGRTDLKQFYAGAALMRNIEPLPQAGARLTPRTRHLGRIRNAIELVASGSDGLSLGPHAGAATIITVTFDARPISQVRLAGLSSDVAINDLMQVEYFNGSTWVSFANSFSVGSIVRTHCVTLPPRQTVTAGGVRLRLTGAPASPATFTLASASALVETSTLPAARVRAFTSAEDETFVALIADNFVDFYENGVFVGGAAASVGTDNVGTVDAVQRLDTMFLFHRDLVPQRIVQVADDEWPVDNAPFENIPDVDLGGTYVNGVDDEWQVEFRFASGGGGNLKAELTINGERTTTVAMGGAYDNAARLQFAADLAAALNALPSVGGGVQVVEVSNSATAITYDFTFTGESGQQEFVFAAQAVDPSTGSALVRHTTRGKPGGEPLFSVSAGYPACGTFFQDRLIMGGFRSKVGAWLASVTGEYFDLNIEILAASGAILINLDTDGAERLQQVVRGTHLVMFTSDGEFFVSDRALDHTQTPNIVSSSRIGVAAGVPVIESEGELIFVSQNRALIYGSHYDDVAQKYVSDPLSLLAAHIANGVVDQALEKSQIATAANRLWQVRDDGTVVLGILIRNQEVTSFVRWETAGAVKSVCVDGANVPHLIVQRDVDGAPELHLERAELGLLFDGTVSIANSPASDVVAGLDMHEGAEVWAKADGYVVGPFMVAGGQITLPNPASEIDVGRWTPPRALTLPLPSEVAERIVLRRPKRVHTVRVDLIDTTSVAVGANGQPASDVPLYHAGDPTDAPLAPFNGRKDVEGLIGFSDEGQVEITQTKPGLLQWRGLTIEART